MHNTEDTVTRTELPNGKFAYAHNGREVLAASSVRYEFASIYNASKGKVCCFHKTFNAAVRGSADMNRYCERVAGVVTIKEGA